MHWSFLIFVIGIIAGGLTAEETLKVRPKETNRERPVPGVTHSDEAIADLYTTPPFHRTSLQFHIVTPLLQEVFPEKRFRAWGNYLSASIYLTQIARRAYIHFEPGVGVSLIRLSLTQPAIDFTHLFIFFPMRLRILYQINDKFFMEAFGGLALRPWEYDSREPPDGGFHRTLTDGFTADGGFGAGFFLNENLFARTALGIQWLFMGMGILL